MGPGAPSPFASPSNDPILKAGMRFNEEEFGRLAGQDALGQRPKDINKIHDEEIRMQMAWLVPWILEFRKKMVGQ